MRQNTTLLPRGTRIVRTVNLKLKPLKILKWGGGGSDSDWSDSFSSAVRKRGR